MLAFARGEATEGFVVHVPDGVDVKAIRRQHGLTQVAFAKRFGFTHAALRDWEIGRRRPERAARILWRLIEMEPGAVKRVLAAG